MGAITLEQLYHSVQDHWGDQTHSIENILAAALHEVGYTAVIAMDWFTQLDDEAQQALDTLHERRMFAHHYQLPLQNLNRDDAEVPPLTWLPDSPMAQALAALENQA